MPTKQQTGIVPRSLDKKAHRVQLQMSRIKANAELPGITAVRLLNEDIIAACVWACKWVCVKCARFPTDLRIQVLNHNNKPEKLTFPEKTEVTIFEARISVFLIE